MIYLYFTIMMFAQVEQSAAIITAVIIGTMADITNDEDDGD